MPTVEVLISIFVLGAHLIFLDHLVLKDLQDLQEKQVHKDLRESKDLLEKQVHKDLLEKQVHKDLRESKDLQDRTRD
jgi:hypothetical protein